VAFQPGEVGIEGAEARNPLSDICAPFGQEGRERCRGLSAMSRVAPAGDLCGLGQRHAETPELDQQAEVLYFLIAVLAIGIVTARSPGQPAGSLVEAHRVGRGTDAACQLADLHA
jgi:hypothetical protein